MSESTLSTSKTRIKHKIVFCWLAFFTGALGGHWLYAGKKRWVFYVCFFPLSAFAGWIDAMRIGLMPDPEFNQKFNEGLNAPETQMNVWVVIAVALSLAISVLALMSSIAAVVQLQTTGYIG